MRRFGSCLRRRSPSALRVELANDDEVADIPGKRRSLAAIGRAAVRVGGARSVTPVALSSIPRDGNRQALRFFSELVESSNRPAANDDFEGRGALLLFSGHSGELSAPLLRFNQT